MAAINPDAAAIAAAIAGIGAVIQMEIQGLPAALGPLINPAVPAAAAPPFHRSPLGVGAANVIDMTSKEGIKQYRQATKSLFPEGQSFDVEPDMFQTFMALLSQRTAELGMMAPGQIALVPPDPAVPGVGPFINVINNYGEKTLEEIKARDRRNKNRNHTG